MEHFIDENCPLWHWLVSRRTLQRSFMPLFATFGTINARRGAFDAMRLIAEPIDDSIIERDKALKGALAEKSEARLKASALKYLEECGTNSDLNFIQAELSRDDRQTRQWPIQAILRILLRENRDKALKALGDFQTDSLDEKILQRLFVPGARFDPATLAKGLSSRSTQVRLAIIRQMRSQNSFTNEIAEPLLTDSSTQVRLESLQALVELGRQFSLDEAKRILVRPASTGLFSLGLGGYDQQGTEAFEQFRAARLSGLTKPELDELIQSASVYDEIPFLTRADKYFEECGNELRAAIADKFEKYFSETLSRMAVSGWTEVQIQKTSSVADFIRKKMTRKDLDIICRKASLADIDLVRATLKSEFVAYSNEDVKYFHKFGE